MAGKKAVVVIVFDEPGEPEGMWVADMVDRARPLFADEPNVKVFMGIREIADKVVSIFQEDDRI